jgi:hypothetical protein
MPQQLSTLLKVFVPPRKFTPVVLGGTAVTIQH